MQSKATRYEEPWLTKRKKESEQKKKVNKSFLEIIV